jgi:hypothetical protein
MLWCCMDIHEDACFVATDSSYYACLSPRGFIVAS